MNNPHQSQATSIKKCLNKRSTIVGLLVVLGLLTIGVVATLFFTEESTRNRANTDQTSAGSTDWLQPKEEILIGEERYVSPCQLVTPGDVKNIVQALPGDTKIYETYVDASISEKQAGSGEYVSTICDYFPGLKLEVNQYFDRSNIVALPRSLGAIDPRNIENVLSKYEKAAAQAGSNDAQAIVKKMKESANFYKTHIENFTLTSDITTADTNGLLIPVSDQRYEFKFLYDNVIYTLKLASFDSKDTQKPQFDEASVKRLVQLEKLYNHIIERLKKKDLPQSPAPTIISTAASPSRDIPILEACSVLSNATFKSITGVQVGGIVERETVTVDTSTKRDTKIKTDMKSFPKNSCKRKSVDTGSSSNNIHSVQIELHSGDTPTAAIDSLKNAEVIPIKKPYIELKTDAEFALQRVISKDISGYLFTAGPYYGTVSYQIEKGSGFPKDVSQKLHVKAINSLYGSLKSDIEQAE